MQRKREGSMISVIIPSYNESGNIARLASSVERELRGESEYELVFIDDGSTDTTLEEIKSVARENEAVRFISLSRNYGHQRALKAGLDYASGDCVISMDADMQHPPELIPQLIEKWREGYDVVYTIRRDVENVGVLKRATSSAFYRVINCLSDVAIPLGAADFRLLGRNVVDEIKGFRENWVFLRGLVSWLGFRQVGVEYVPNRRYSGETKYSTVKMMAFAVQGITSFSILPLRMAMFAGIAISSVSFVYALYALYVKLFTAVAIRGWTSILISVLFLGGIQLVCLGVIGEYLGKLFIEAKRRPNYVIREKSL